VKRFAWLAAAAAVVAILIGINAYQPAPVVALDMAAMPVLAHNVQLADRIQIVHQGAVLDLERRGQTWCLSQNGGYPVRPEMAQRLLDQLLALRLSHPSKPGRSGLRIDNPKDVHSALTGVRVLATTGAGLGALIVADHDPAATQFIAHQVGDPRDWQATGQLNPPTDPLNWIDPNILLLDPTAVTGAMVSHGKESFALDEEEAAGRLKALEDLTFSDVHPAAQMLIPETGRAVFTLTDGGVLTVSVRAQADQVWLGLHATTPGATNVPGGDWVFHYPPDALALLQRLR
jgi:hypothetical protein